MAFRTELLQGHLHSSHQLSVCSLSALPSLLTSPLIYTLNSYAGGQGGTYHSMIYLSLCPH